MKKMKCSDFCRLSTEAGQAWAASKQGLQITAVTTKIMKMSNNQMATISDTEVLPNGGLSIKVYAELCASG